MKIPIARRAAPDANVHAVARYAAPAHTVERIISGSSESTHAVGRIGVGVDIGTGDSERGDLEGGETGGDGDGDGDTECGGDAGSDGGIGLHGRMSSKCLWGGRAAATAIMAYCVCSCCLSPCAHAAQARVQGVMHPLINYEMRRFGYDTRRKIP